MKFTNTIDIYKDKFTDISIYDPVTNEVLFEAEEILKRPLDRAIVDILKYSNGVGMQFLTIYGISNRNIADIIRFNDHLDQEYESGKFIYFSSSGPLAFSYEVATKKVYYEDFEEIGPVRTSLYDSLDDFFQQIAEKVEYIYENQLNDKIYTLKDENLPNVIRIA